MKELMKRNDLEERTLDFARNVRIFIKKLPKSAGIYADGSQVIRSSGSIGANYIEAQGALSRKDFAMRIKICRKEAKETHYWLDLLDVPFSLSSERKLLMNEAVELVRMFTAMVKKLIYHFVLIFLLLTIHYGTL